VYASEGLPGPIPEHVGRRLHTQEGEDGLVGEDDLPMFVQEDQDIGNRIEDLLFVSTISTSPWLARV
jgi:hypothetical protein